MYREQFRERKMSLVEPTPYGKSIPVFSVTTKRQPACIHIIPSMCHCRKWDLSYQTLTPGAQTDLIAEIGGHMQVCSKSAVI